MRRNGTIVRAQPATRHPSEPGRRGFLATLAAWLPSAAIAQAPAKIPRIGALHWEGSDATFRVTELREALASVGLRDGVNIVIDWRWADANGARAAEQAAALEASGVALIFVHSTPTIHAAKAAAPRTPLVVQAADVLSTGIVSNLTRPGGLVTGVATFGTDLAAKRLEALREAVPGLTRIGFLGSTVDPNSETFIRETLLAGERMGIAVEAVRIPGPQAFGAALDTFVAAGVGAVIMQGLFVATARGFVEPALRRGLPCAGDQPNFAAAGALMALGAERAHVTRRNAAQIDRILKGARPGDMPVERATVFRLVLNQRTARILGLTLPPSLLVRADELIE